MKQVNCSCVYLAQSKSPTYYVNAGTDNSHIALSKRTGTPPKMLTVHIKT